MKAFDLKRFSRLFVAEGRATAKQSLLLCGVALLLGVGYMLYCLGDRSTIYAFSMLMGFCFFAIYVLQGFYTYLQWQDLASRTRKAALLLQPVSKSELFTVKTIYCFVIFPLICLGLMFLILWMGQGVNYRLMDAATFEAHGRFLMTESMCQNLNVGLTAYTLIAMVYWTGSFFFKKWAPLKTVIFIVAAILLLSFAGAGYFDLISTDFNSTYVPFSYFFARYGDGSAISWWASDHFTNCVFIGMFVYLYVLSVYKFKETTL